MSDVPIHSIEPLIAATAPAKESRLRVVARNAFPFLVLGLIWEITARAGVFPPKLFPTLETVGQAIVRLTLNGILLHHALDTILRLVAGFVLSGRRRRRHRHLDGPFAADSRAPCCRWSRSCAPIPRHRPWAPLFLLWFGLGNQPAILLVGFVSLFPIIFNTWTGVKAVKDIWVRSAQAMGADDRRLSTSMSSCRAPLLLHPHRAAARLGAGLAHAGRHRDARRGAVGPRLDDLRRARVPQHRDVMLAGVVVIGVLGRRAGEAGVPASRGRFTVMRWGMMMMISGPHRVHLDRAPP